MALSKNQEDLLRRLNQKHGIGITKYPEFWSIRIWRSVENDVRSSTIQELQNAGFFFIDINSNKEQISITFDY